ncbi:MAG: multicopper oxidase family protein [Bosea sp. (in: a-proteobacteria)]
MTDSPHLISRRTATGLLLAASAGSPVFAQTPAATPAPASAPVAAPTTPLRTLVARPARFRLRPSSPKDAECWAFDGVVPGPAIRIKLGEELRLKVESRIEKPISLHFHGLRGLSAMDGVGGFSQDAIAPGASFEYRFTPPDAGSFLFRPLVIGASGEVADRGLSGMLIVEEAGERQVDHDIPVIIDDWLLADDGAVEPFVANTPEAAGAGRLGSWLTANGKAPPERISLPASARVRLRLANACNARITRLRFDGMKAFVAAVDSQPTDTFEPVRAQLPFPPGSRYDILFDMPEQVGEAANVIALIGAGVPLVRLVSEAPKPGPARPPRGDKVALAPNKALPAAVRLQDARRIELLMEGGAKITPEFKLDLTGVDLAKPWSLNGRQGDAKGPPLFSVKRGTPMVLTLINKTAFAQPLHVHGHSFRLLHPLDDGWEPYFLDTLQVPEGRTLRIAFIADNPGKWLISSTVLERFDVGFWTWFEVT